MVDVNDGNFLNELVDRFFDIFKFGFFCCVFVGENEMCDEFVGMLEVIGWIVIICLVGVVDLLLGS